MKKFSNNLLINLACIIPGLLIFLISCTKEGTPTASFTISGTNVVGDSIVFTNNSSNAGYYQWSFGDGQYAITQNTKHAYTNGGNYTVTLIAIGDNKSSKISKSLVVTGTITIFEGVGISEVSLSDSWDIIQNKFKGQDTAMYNDTSGQYYVHTLYLIKSGIYVSFYNFLPSTIDTSETPDEISVVTPYSGYTTKGITIGNNISEVFSIYGKSGVYVDGVKDTLYYYDSLGVHFWTSPPSPDVAEIDVYTPSASDNSLIENKSIKMVPARNKIFARKAGKPL